MVKTVMVFIIAIIFLVIAFLIKRSHQKESAQIETYKQTYATIDRTIFSDTGEVMYYVTFTENGNKITAQTDYYTSETKSLDPGDEVKIGYYFTKKGTPLAVIFDERVIPVSNSVPRFYKSVTVIGLLLLIVAVVMFFHGCTAHENGEENNGYNDIVIELDNSIPLMNYDNSSALLANPDRGLRMETYITLGDPLYSYPLNEEDPFERAQSVIDKYREDSPTLCQVYVYLSNYSDRELDDLAFEQLERYFELFRSNNTRMLLRFAYSTESVDDAPYKIVSRHIGQLKDWFANEEELINDTLYCLQTGIIGYWGEGHSYHNLKKRNIKKVIADVAELAPQGIYTQVRTYEMLDLVSDEDRDKVGIHDDYIVGDMYHEWSFIPKKYSKKFNKAVEHAKLTVNDGEMPWGRETVETENGTVTLNALDGKAVLEQLATYSMTSFSLEHNYCEDGNRNSLERWKDEYLGFDELKEFGINANPQLFKDGNGDDIKLSVYDILRYHLGYQLVLSNLIENSESVSFSVTNYGFAAPLNFNYFALVCRNTSGELIEIEIEEYDKTVLQSGKSAVYSVTLPENCEAIGVKLDTFKDRNICVRFANDTQYKNGIQYFK